MAAVLLLRGQSGRPDEWPEQGQHLVRCERPQHFSTINNDEPDEFGKHVKLNQYDELVRILTSQE